MTNIINQAFNNQTYFINSQPNIAQIIKEVRPGTASPVQEYKNKEFATSPAPAIYEIMRQATPVQTPEPKKETQPAVVQQTSASVSTSPAIQSTLNEVKRESSPRLPSITQMVREIITPQPKQIEKAIVSNDVLQTSEQSIAKVIKEFIPQTHPVQVIRTPEPTKETKNQQTSYTEFTKTPSFITIDKEASKTITNVNPAVQKAKLELKPIIQERSILTEHVHENVKNDQKEVYISSNQNLVQEFPQTTNIPSSVIKEIDSTQTVQPVSQLVHVPNEQIINKIFIHKDVINEPPYSSTPQPSESFREVVQANRQEAYLIRKDSAMRSPDHQTLNEFHLEEAILTPTITPLPNFIQKTTEIFLPNSKPEATERVVKTPDYIINNQIISKEKEVVKETDEAVRLPSLIQIVREILPSPTQLQQTVTKEVVKTPETAPIRSKTPEPMITKIITDFIPTNQSTTAQTIQTPLPSITQMIRETVTTPVPQAVETPEPKPEHLLIKETVPEQKVIKKEIIEPKIIREVTPIPTAITSTTSTQQIIQAKTPEPIIAKMITDFIPSSQSATNQTPIQTPEPKNNQFVSATTTTPLPSITQMIRDTIKTPEPKQNNLLINEINKKEVEETINYTQSEQITNIPTNQSTLVQTIQTPEPIINSQQAVITPVSIIQMIRETTPSRQSTPVPEQNHLLIKESVAQTIISKEIVEPVVLKQATPIPVQTETLAHEKLAHDIKTPVVKSSQYIEEKQKEVLQTLNDTPTNTVQQAISEQDKRETIVSSKPPPSPQPSYLSRDSFIRTPTPTPQPIVQKEINTPSTPIHRSTSSEFIYSPEPKPKRNETERIVEHRSPTPTPTPPLLDYELDKEETENYEPVTTKEFIKDERQLVTENNNSKSILTQSEEQTVLRRSFVSRGTSPLDSLPIKSTFGLENAKQSISSDLTASQTDSFAVSTKSDSSKSCQETLSLSISKISLDPFSLTIKYDENNQNVFEKHLTNFSFENNQTNKTSNPNKNENSGIQISKSTLKQSASNKYENDPEILNTYIINTDFQTEKSKNVQSLPVRYDLSIDRNEIVSKILTNGTNNKLLAKTSSPLDLKLLQPPQDMFLDNHTSSICAQFPQLSELSSHFNTSNNKDTLNIDNSVVFYNVASKSIPHITNSFILPVSNSSIDNKHEQSFDLTENSKEVFTNSSKYKINKYSSRENLNELTYQPRTIPVKYEFDKKKNTNEIGVSDYFKRNKSLDKNSKSNKQIQNNFQSIRPKEVSFDVDEDTVFSAESTVIFSSGFDYRNLSPSVAKRKSESESSTYSELRNFDTASQYSEFTDNLNKEILAAANDITFPGCCDSYGDDLAQNKFQNHLKKFQELQLKQLQHFQMKNHKQLKMMHQQQRDLQKDLLKNFLNKQDGNNNC